MINGAHLIVYSRDADADRAFIRDVLGYPHVDVGGGWLIFDLPDAALGCHPTDHTQSPPSGTHQISFYCDDIEKTVAELKGRGVEFTRPVKDAGYGLTTDFKMPGGIEVELYQPKYKRNPSGGAGSSAG